MLLIHPMGQIFGILLSFYVFYLGLARFKSLHAHQHTTFKWKRHVILGIIVSMFFVGGLIGGMSIVYFYWHGFFMTKVHSKIGLIIAFIILFGLGSGLYMNSTRKKQTILPLVHGLSNLVAVMLALSQIWTGVIVYLRYVVGI
ncbi:MAG: DUF4079 domain-containing protein [bacterium]